MNIHEAIILYISSLFSAMQIPVDKGEEILLEFCRKMLRGKGEYPCNHTIVIEKPKLPLPLEWVDE